MFLLQYHMFRISQTIFGFISWPHVGDIDLNLVTANSVYYAVLCDNVLPVPSELEVAGAEEMAHG